jgi:DinB superfamily
MAHDLHHIIALLERTPGALDELLRGLPPEWTEGNEGGDTWSPREVVAHLSHADRTEWIAHLLEHGESRPFPTFNREGGKESIQGKTMADLLDEFAATRAASLNKLRAMELTDEHMQRSCVHQVLGKVTLAQLLATWAAHDVTHLHQITRIWANHLRDEVGPFRRFLGVTQCSARSEDAAGKPR